MTRRSNYVDQLGRLVQVGSGGESISRTVRLTSVWANNIYNARPIEFDETGQPQTVGQAMLRVTNLAEPADTPGVVLADGGTVDAVAMDLGGRWVVFIRRAWPAMFPAKVISSQGSAVYTLREQAQAPDGTFSDAPGAAEIIATNLAELSTGQGGAIDIDTTVAVTSIIDTGQPATLRYIFSQAAYAKYLD
jgi:hypothetical protein